MLHRIPPRMGLAAWGALGVCAVALACPRTGLAQVGAEKSAALLKPADGLEATLWASEPMVHNPTNMDIDSRGRVWVTEGLNYRLYPQQRDAPRRGVRQDQDPRGHRRRRQGRQDDRLRRQDLPRPDGPGGRGAVRQGRQVPRVPRLRRQQPRPARPRGHRRRRQGRQAIPAAHRLRRGRLRPRRPRDGPGPRRQALLHPRRRLLLGPGRPLDEDPELRRHRQERPARLLGPARQHLARQPRRHPVRDPRRPPAQQLRDQPERLRQHLHQRQRRRRQPGLPGDLDHGRRPLRLPDPGEPPPLGRGGPRQRPQARRHRQRQPVRPDGLRGRPAARGVSRGDLRGRGRDPADQLLPADPPGRRVPDRTTRCSWPATTPGSAPST